MPKKRQQMMLAQAVEVDIPHDHHFAIVDAEEGAVEHLVNVRAVPARQEPERILDSRWCPEKAFPIRVFAQRCQHLSDVILHRSSRGRGYRSETHDPLKIQRSDIRVKAG